MRIADERLFHPYGVYDDKSCSHPIPN